MLVYFGTVTSNCEASLTKVLQVKTIVLNLSYVCGLRLSRFHKAALFS